MSADKIYTNLHWYFSYISMLPHKHLKVWGAVFGKLEKKKTYLKNNVRNEKGETC